MTDGLDVSDLAARMDNSVCLVVVPFFRKGFIDPRLKGGPVLRMDPLEKPCEPRDRSSRIEAQDSVTLLGPVPDLARGGDPGPVPHVAQPLGFGQIRFALPQLVFCQLSLDGDARG